jgi:hypothetical protein
MFDATSRFRETLLIERVADALGVTALSEWLPGPRVYPPYLFLGVLLLVDFGIVNTIIHVTVGRHLLVTTPTAIAAIPGLFLALIGIRYMADGYSKAVARLRIPDRDIQRDSSVFERTVSQRAKLLAYVLGAVLLTTHVVVNMSSMIISFAGVPGLIHRLVMWNVYLLFVVEFAFLYFSVHVLVPRRLNAADVGMFYYDPENMGGFGPLGQLLKRSYYLYTGGLLLFFVLSYGPVFLASYAPSLVASDLTTTVAPTTTAFFTLAWVVGVLSIAYSMLSVHRLMATEKQRHIAALEAELRDVIQEPYEITTAEGADEADLSDIERRLEQVRSTRVYPATFTMWSQIALSVVLPQALQLVVQAT